MGLPTHRIRAWTRRGLLTPSRGADGACLYSLQDIALLRGAAALLERIPVQRIGAVLERLRDQLPAGRPLSSVYLSTLGSRLLVADEGTMWDPDTGQVELPLSDGAANGGAEARFPRAPAGLPGADDPGADDAFERGLALEARDPPAAERAYRRALRLDPSHTGALLNLGRLRHADGAVEEALRLYERAAASDPTDGRARYNLGVALEDLGREDEAAAAYGEAVELEPELAAAHFNLSRIHEKAGRLQAALRHLLAYRHALGRDC